MDDVSAITAANVSNQVSMAVAKKAMEADKEQGQAMVELIRRAMPTPPEQQAGAIDLYA